MTFFYAVVADEQYVYTMKFQFENACNFLTSQITYLIEKKGEIFKNFFLKNERQSFKVVFCFYIT